MGKAVKNKGEPNTSVKKNQSVLKLVDINPEMEKLWERLSELAIASESSLKKDWLTDEEDEAWRDL